MNYLQYIHSVYQPAQSNAAARFLVSGVDSHVRQSVGQHILHSTYDAGKILFILDSTQSGNDFTHFGSFTVLNPLNGDVDLCYDFFEMSSIREISRLRSLLTALGFDEIKVMKVVNYLSFVRETEYRLGNNRPLCIETLEEYGGTTLVKWKLCQLVEQGILSNENCEYLLNRYAEVSAAAADFEMFLVALAPFIGGASKPSPGTAIHLPVGEFTSDKSMQEIQCRLMLSFIKKQPESCSVFIVDDGKSNRDCIVKVLKNLPTATDAYMFSADAFSLDDNALSVLMSAFPARIYSRHDSMDSCYKIEKCCGQIDVVKHSYTTTIDKRICSSTAFDMLFGTNRTETEVRNAPVKEARYRKEKINSMYPGTGIIDCGGTQVMFQF